MAVSGMHILVAGENVSASEIKCIQHKMRCLGANTGKKPAFSATLATLLLLTITVGCNIVSDEPTEQSSGELASWNEQLATAQREATQIDANAVVHWVLAGYSSDELINHKPSDATFIFVRPNGVRMRIEVEDSSPARVISVKSEWDKLTIAPLEESLRQYRSLLSSVQKGPREAALNAIKDTKVPQTMITVSMYLSENYQPTLGTPIVWAVSYYDSAMDPGVTVYVSPQTGQPLDQPK
jgi:hypothetical protein